jgi:hypothetical protein
MILFIIFCETLVGIVRENITRMNQLGKAMLRVALVALGLLMVPLVASQMMDGWNWDAGTFVIVYVMFFGTGMAYADIAKNGSDFLTDKGIISDFVAHKKFVIKFASASGDQITDEYLTDGLSVKSLRADCPALFKKR